MISPSDSPEAPQSPNLLSNPTQLTQLSLSLWFIFALVYMGAYGFRLPDEDDPTNHFLEGMGRVFALVLCGVHLVAALTAAMADLLWYRLPSLHIFGFLTALFGLLVGPVYLAVLATFFLGGGFFLISDSFFEVPREFPVLVLWGIYVAMVLQALVRHRGDAWIKALAVAGVFLLLLPLAVIRAEIALSYHRVPQIENLFMINLLGMVLHLGMFFSLFVSKAKGRELTSAFTTGLLAWWLSPGEKLGFHTLLTLPLVAVFLIAYGLWGRSQTQPDAVGEGELVNEPVSEPERLMRFTAILQGFWIGLILLAAWDLDVTADSLPHYQRGILLSPANQHFQLPVAAGIMVLLHAAMILAIVRKPMIRRQLLPAHLVGLGLAMVILYLGICCW